MKVPITEKFFYVIWCILSLGFIWIMKIIIKMAIAECENSKVVK